MRFSKRLFAAALCACSAFAFGFDVSGAPGARSVEAADDSPAIPIADGTPIRVLFIGNSFTFYNSLERMTADALNVSGIAAEATRSAPGGWRLRQHFNGETPKNYKFASTPDVIAGSDWDYVVLQEQSSAAVDARAEFLEYGAKLVDSIRAKRPETTVLLYQTWGRCDGMFAGYGDDPARRDAVLAAWEKRYSKPDDATIAALKDGLQGGYAALAEKTGATVVPVGEGFAKVGDKIDLYADEPGKKPFHPSEAGTYLAACSFFKTISGRSPVGLYAKLTAAGREFKFSAEDAATLEKIADETVPTPEK